MRKSCLITSDTEMEKIRERWVALRVVGRHTIFQSFRWNQLAARVFAGKHMPLIAISENDSGMAIIPACIDVKNKRLSLLGETLFDYRDTLTAGDLISLRRAWSELASIAAKNECTFEFHSLREDSAGLGKWSGFERVPTSSAPFILRDDRSGEAHSRLLRNMRRLETLGVKAVRYDGKALQLLRTIYSLKSQGPDSLFRDQQRISFITALAQDAPSTFDIFTLEQGSTLAAAIVTFRDGLFRRFYTTYFDPAFAKHSPGITLLHHAVQETLSEGLNCDFLTGDQPYKRRLATAAAPLFRVGANQGTMRAIANGTFAAHAA